MVWAVNPSSLRAFDRETGNTLYTSFAGTLDAMHWVAPIVARRRIDVGGNTKIYAFTAE
jgi:hypothetical protein